jgi:hypothetical protein
MRRVLFTALVLIGAFTAQAQTESKETETSIRTQAKQYARSKEKGNLEITTPQLIRITENKEGYCFEVQGIHNGEEYKISITHSTTAPQETCTISTAGKECDFEKGVVFGDADRIVFTKSPNMQSTVITKEGEEGYTFKIRQQSIVKETRTVYKETFSNWDFNIPFVKQEKQREKQYRPYADFEFNLLSNLEFGMGLAAARSQAPGMDADFDNAGMEFFLNNLFSWEYRPFNKTHLYLGFGVDWKNYKMKGGNRFVKENDKVIIAPYPEGAEINYSRIRVFSLTLDLMLRQNFNRNISIEAGPIVNFNTSASTKTRYTICTGNEKEGVRERNNRIHQRPVTVDFKAQLNISPIGFYFKYSPMNVLDTNYGPEFKSMSAGLAIEF